MVTGTYAPLLHRHSLFTCMPRVALSSPLHIGNTPILITENMIQNGTNLTAAAPLGGVIVFRLHDRDAREGLECEMAVSGSEGSPIV